MALVVNSMALIFKTTLCSSMNIFKLIGPGKGPTIGKFITNIILHSIILYIYIYRVCCVNSNIYTFTCMHMVY